MELPALVSLTLSRNTLVGATLHYVGQRAPLQHLDLTGASGLDLEDLAALRGPWRTAPPRRADIFRLTRGELMRGARSQTLAASRPWRSRTARWPWIHCSTLCAVCDPGRRGRTQAWPGSLAAFQI